MAEAHGRLVKPRSRLGEGLYWLVACAGVVLALFAMGNAPSPPSLSLENHVTPFSSSLMAHVVPCVLAALFLHWALLYLVEKLRVVRAARAAGRSSLEPGAGRVLFGTVEAGRPPVVFGIKLKEGEDFYFEVERRVRSEPFELDVDGTRVRVEPGETPTLLTEPDGSSGDADDFFAMIRGERGRTIALWPADEVHVTGTLSAGPPYVLHARALSTLPPGERSRIRARRFRWMVLAVLLLAAPVAYPLYGFLRSVHLGTAAEGKVVSLRESKSMDSEGAIDWHYTVGLWMAPGQPHEGHAFVQEVPGWQLKKLREGQIVPVNLVVGSPETARIGPAPTIHAGLFVGLLFQLVVALVLSGIVLFRPTGWWDGPFREKK